MSFGAFAGGLSEGFRGGWRLAQDAQRAKLDEERAKRQNELDDLRIDATKDALEDAREARGRDKQAREALTGIEDRALAVEDWNAQTALKGGVDAQMAEYKAAAVDPQTGQSRLTPQHEEAIRAQLGMLKSPVQRFRFDIERGRALAKAGKIDEARAHFQQAEGRAAGDALAAVLGRDLKAAQGLYSLYKDGQDLVAFADNGDLVMRGADGRERRVSQYDAATALAARMDPKTAFTMVRDAAKQDAQFERLLESIAQRDRALEARLSGSGGSGGSGSGTRAGAERAFDPVKSLKDFQDMGGDARSHLVFKRLVAANPGMAESEAGMTNLLSASLALGEGGAQYRPVLKEDGTYKLMVKPEGSPDEFVFEDGMDEARMRALWGAQTRTPGASGWLGNTPEGSAVDDELIEAQYLEALRKRAVQTPEQFKSAWVLAHDPKLLEEVQARAAEGDAAAREALAVYQRLAPTIARGAAQARKTAQMPRNRPDAQPAAERPRADPALAETLGLDAPAPQTYGVGDVVRGIGSATASGARAVGRVLTEPNRNQVEAELRNYENAVSAVARRSAAERLYQMVEGHPDLVEMVRRRLGTDARTSSGPITR